MKACLDTSTCPCTNMFFKCESSILQVVNASKIGFLTGQGRPSKEKLDIVLSYNLYHACQAVSTSELLSVNRGKDLAWGTLLIKFLLPTEKQIPFHPDEYEWFLWNCQEYSEYVFFFRVLSTFMFLALATPVITFPHHGPVTTRFRKSQWSVTVNLAQVVINSLETLLEIKENWSNLSPNHCWLGAFWKACCILWRSNKGCYVDP